MWQRAVLGGVILLLSATGVEAQSSRPDAVVDELYVRYFGREPYYSELDYWVDRMERRGDSSTVVEAGIIGSPAYFQQNKHNTTRWIRDVFRKVAGRSPSGDELDWWRRRLSQYRGNREEWALEFLSEMTSSRRNDDDRYYDDGYREERYSSRRPVYREEIYSDGAYDPPPPRNYRQYDDTRYYAPRTPVRQYDDRYYQDEYYPSRGAATGSRIGARIGGAIAGPEGAAIGAGIGRDIGIQAER